MEITGFSYSLSFLSLPLSSSSFLDSTHSLFRDVESRSYEHARGLDEESRTKKKEGNENTINKEKSTKQIDVKTSNLFLLVRARIVSRGMHTPSIRGFESSTILESKKKEKKKIPLQAATFSRRECDDPSRRAEFGSKSIDIDPF